GKHPSFATQLHVEFADGTTQVIDSDSTWKMSSGPLTASDIQDGEQYDARLENDGWDWPGYNDSKWQTVTVKANGRNLVAQMDPSIGVIHEITPVSVTEPSPGCFVYDLGQNITGVVRIQANGARGTIISLQHAERLNDDGTLDRSNLTVGKQTAEAKDTYVMSGAGVETFQPRFTFHGFRYFSVQGLAEAPALTDVTGVAIGSRLPETGSLQTFDEELNQLISNIKWTAQNACLSVPMDCPQRAERLGWTGDANVMGATAAFLFDMSRFYAKWECDILDSQALNDDGPDEGVMPNVSPKFPPLKGGKGGGWGDAGVNLPYIMWKRSGDTDIIGDSYAGMKKWLTYLERNSTDHVITSRVSTAGDWQNVDDDTPRNLIATFYYAVDVSQMAEMAAAMGQEDDVARYRTLFENIRSAFIKKWVAADGTVANGSQTAQVFALHLGLLPENLRPAAVQKLLDSIIDHQYHLTTGYLGSQWLLHVLADNGHTDIAYKVLQQRTYPSWLYMVGMNQTTIWESWGSLNPDGTFAVKRKSLNHEALGSVGDWMFQSIGGLVPDAASPAFKHFTIRPRPGGTLRHAEVTYQSPHGIIVSEWTLKDNQFSLDVEVPVNSSATIVLPTANVASITESGLPAASSPGVVYAGINHGSASYDVGSGRYSFAAMLTSSPVGNHSE
ncbi:MAG: glycoside hydrolase family 78 protein, partial [Planctomycetes bacterium]|nr:glycoside hydrolase family 78 protein [Planctomycetota bacterium]